ncbi:MAG: DoxX family protein [Rikenellaceae bacterium]|nr:DoxX family protein [Rikenellaceae bacterium]
MRGFLCALFASRGKSAGLLILRLFAGGILLPHGIQKIENYNALSHSFPDPIGLGSTLSFILILLTETVGSVFVILGLLTRPAALAVSLGMFVAAFLSSPDGFSSQSSQLPLLLMGVYLSLIFSGAGRYSLDGAIFERTCSRECCRVSQNGKGLL